VECAERVFTPTEFAGIDVKPNNSVHNVKTTDAASNQNQPHWFNRKTFATMGLGIDGVYCLKPGRQSASQFARSLDSPRDARKLKHDMKNIVSVSIPWSWHVA